MGRLLLLWELQPKPVHGQTVSRRESTHLPETEAGKEKQRLSPVSVSKSTPLRKSASLQDSDHRSMDPDCESLWKKMIGKPYSGKLNVRFDEGELEIECQPLRQLSTLPVIPPKANFPFPQPAFQLKKNFQVLLRVNWFARDRNEKKRSIYIQPPKVPVFGRPFFKPFFPFFSKVRK